MSPSEHDLRAALRDGQDDPGNFVDIDRIVAGGRAKAAQRRSNLLTAAVAVVFIGAAGAIGSVLASGGGSGNGGAGSDARAQNRAPAATAAGDDGGKAAQAPRATPSSGATPFPSNPAALPDHGGSPTDTSVACPASFPRRLLPGGGSPGRFGAGGPLFEAKATTIVVCAYGSPLRASQDSRPGRFVLGGPYATALQDSLESASKAPASTSCVSGSARDQRALAFIGVDAAGNTMRTVTTTLSDPPCNVKVTNGTAVRYDWRPPAKLRDVLRELQPLPGPPVPIPNHTPSGKNHGSPPR